MSIGHDKLKSIGAQKIHEATHISRQHVQAVIHESYDDMSRVQFLGFISILEREYNLDLSDLKSKGISHFDELIESSEKENKVFVSVKKKKNYTFLYAFVAIVIFVVVSYFSLRLSSSTDSNLSKIDNTSIENATANIIQLEDNVNIINEINTSIETNTTLENNVSNIPKTFIIKPKADLWIGYMDLDTNEKYQKTILKSEEFSIDSNKKWLLTFGHGFFDINLTGETKTYTDKNTVRFTYKDGNMTKINYREFLKLEKGN